MFSFCFRGVTQLNSSNPIGSASKTARFGASVFVKELIKDSIEILSVALVCKVLLLLLQLLFLFCFSAFWYSVFGASFPLAKNQYEACFCTCPIVAIHSLHFCWASFLLGQRGLGVPQRGNISLYHGTVKKSQWHSFLLLSVSPLTSFVQTTGWALALFAGNEPFFFKTS